MIRTSRKQIVERTGFTMIELLVVMAIIGLLAALTAGAVMRYLSTQKGNNTETTIAKIDSEFKKQWQKVVDQARIDPIPAGIDSIYGCNGDVNLARVIYIKLKLMQQFPMSFAEVLNPSPNMLPPEPAYVHYLKDEYKAPPKSPALPYESSACLLMALQLDRSRMSLNTDFIGSDSIKTTPTGLPYLADAWEQPLAFYRWPTANSEVNQLNKSTTAMTTVKRDAQDPEGKLMDPNWRYDPVSGNLTLGATQFVKTIHDLTSDPNNKIPLPTNPNLMVANPTSVYVVPVIASPGTNKKLGIDIWNPGPDPMSIGGAGVSNDFTVNVGVPVTKGNQNDANDNLYNFRLTLGGKGN
jgi:prepilin-type N-terminal cleavage/methylation domain-containing protein